MVVAALAGVAASLPAAWAATTEQIVTDRSSGVAINGFDPVSYFIDGSAAVGTAEYEHSFAGVVWRFRNEGNRAAFIADPDRYVPQYGGHDPLGVIRGLAMPGNPRLWLLFKTRLYLFRSVEDRRAFLADAQSLAAIADRKWPDVRSMLSP